MMVMEALSEEGGGYQLAAAPEAQGGVSEARPAVKFVRAPAFPDLGADGLPSRAALRAYLPKFQVACRVNGLAEGDQRGLQRLIKARGVDPGLEWSQGAGEIVFETLVTAGPDGLPERLMLALPAVNLDSKQGIDCVIWILKSVFTSCDDSVGVLSKAFADPTPITRRDRVSQAITHYDDLLDQLISTGAEPPEVTKRTSFKQVFSKIPECVRAFDALEAAAEGDVSLDKMKIKIRALGAKFSSLAKQQTALMADEVACLGEELEGHQKLPMPLPPGVCKFYAGGKCKMGAKCKWKHVGEPGKFNNLSKVIRGESLSETFTSNRFGDMGKIVGESVRDGVGLQSRYTVTPGDRSTFNEGNEGLRGVGGERVVGGAQPYFPHNPNPHSLGNGSAVAHLAGALMEIIN
jgi:hypothetical protein